MEYNIKYESDHRDTITRLGRIDAVIKSERLNHDIMIERLNILSYLSSVGVISLRENNGFVFVGAGLEENRILYLDTVDCY
jgi:hypothetical protein